MASKLDEKKTSLSSGEVVDNPVVDDPNQPEDPNVTVVEGVEYSSSLLVVKFKNTNESNVSNFEEACKGHLLRTLNDNTIYVFELETPLYGEDLLVMSKYLERLDYVESINLSEVSHTN